MGRSTTRTQTTAAATPSVDNVAEDVVEDETPAKPPRGRKPAAKTEPEPEVQDEDEDDDILMSDFPEFASVEEAEEFLAELGISLHEDFNTEDMPKGRGKAKAAVQFVTDLIGDVALVISEAEQDPAVVKGKISLEEALTTQFEDLGGSVPPIDSATGKPIRGWAKLSEAQKVWKLAMEILFASSAEEPEGSEED